MGKYALILAAGEGKRMKSETSKVLHKVCGKEMVNHVIDIMRNAGFEDVNVIVGRSKEQVMDKTSSRNVSYSVQEEQLGTGHAVLCAKEFLQDKEGTVAIFTGDAPLVREETVKEMLKSHEEGGYSATLLTSVIENPSGYGRIQRSGNDVEKIIEHKDCSEEELKLKEINAGMYLFDAKELQEALLLLKNDNAQGEYYLTDVIEIMKGKNLKVGAVITEFDETRGVNSRAQLAEAEAILRKRINEFHMENGVTLIDPLTTYIGADVVIGNDTIIYPNNTLEGKTVLGKGVLLHPNNRIEDSVIEDEVTIASSVILCSKVGKKTTVGPFAYIRPDSVIGEHVKVGDFVEIKKSTIGNGTKISHLTYIGDAEVGEHVNFGCGTVVVNYDGKNKYKTVVEDHAFIGCNTNLVAPVTVHEGAFTAAGSTITENVPKEGLGIARAKQVNKEGWVQKRKESGKY
ncbi:MAG TPA: bifunctional UDP-N-acetylglucosamine diphosphorylase/glucosamine-1-phosphate N-acetyltransferase GlmU [Proteiniclasticum sp.]|uniref:bifunctional UDP-N-acetylglucosamine diphosphorylase/glucosamine-1-phosphate N-acetyltransferase GlmU n=1 Tax=Proteiniclasticum sp. TaxID=2053595 RepID=UPI000E80D9C4|nr:bifunctional UDP-N-acetylglucosamine diphosphorylase/glucosamine-1-phosphate N-acetyltransferase GlmU [Proteiniclasticum sp.]HBW13227.1 bifunctional UDP-N-acetylglucosamine diphosphorylase/glucosamine-1-phosphate N-acetyltransferase GlmU [Proteiniclasticum sp.]